MDEIIYEALSRYYHSLEVKGYMPVSSGYKLLILIFLRDFVFNDFRALLSRDDYRLIERALDCLYGTSCLIPYPDYLKMGKLHLSEMTELAARVKHLEDTNVVKIMHDLDGTEDSKSDVIVVADIED